MYTSSDQFKKVGIYLGYFTIQKWTTNVGREAQSETYSRISYTNESKLSRQELIGLGDMVYAMYVNGVMVKIGKAGSSNGWIGRVGAYAGRDRTNSKICSVMEEDFDYDPSSDLPSGKIEVYAILVPRVDTQFYCPITEEVITITSPRNHQVETYLTAVAESEGEDLIFCNQKV